MRHESIETTLRYYVGGDRGRGRCYLGSSPKPLNKTTNNCPGEELVDGADGCSTRYAHKHLQKVHPTGFEPVTFGSVDRCSIQLS